MPIVAADWTITRANGNIRYIGDDHAGVSPSYASVIELHRYLQDLADDATSTGDDELDIQDENPSNRSTDNIITLLGNYNIDDTAAEHLYDGSIIQSGGDTIYDGIVNFGNSDVQIQIFQNGAVLSDDWWNFSGAGLNPDSANGISHRFMIKVRDAGSDIDGRRLIGTCRRFGFTYSEFGINGTGRGNNVLALSDSSDLNNQTAEGTVATWTTITNQEGYRAIDLDNNGANEFYYSEWNRDTFTINQLYERAKWLTRDGSVSTIYGLNGELFRGITHQISYTSLTGTFDAANPVTFGNGATGQVLADDGSATMWVQLLTGVAPANSDSITQSVPDAASATVNVVTDRSANVSTPFIGASTGSALIAAYGVGVEVADVTQADTFFQLSDPGTAINPPNFVTFSVGGLVSGEDRVLVSPWDGSSTDNEGNPAIDKDQLSLSGNLTTDNITSVVVQEAIPSDTPSSGTIRVYDDNGDSRRLEYSSYTGSTFTITTTDGNEDFATTNASNNNDVYISYIDTLAGSTTESFTSVYSSDRTLVVIVRDGGGTPIKEFISSATLGSGGGSVTAIRTTDA